MLMSNKFENIPQPKHLHSLAFEVSINIEYISLEKLHGHRMVMLHWLGDINQDWLVLVIQNIIFW